MAEVQINSQGKVFVSNNKALLAKKFTTKTITENGTYTATSDNVDGYSSVEVSVSGGTPSGTTDVPLTRISDDNNNEIGTWFMNFEDANGNLYKVVLLDAQYRNASAMWCSSATAVTDLPIYNDMKTSNPFNAKETATTNTQLVLDYCTANSYTSTACSHCRSQSFTINGTTYYGQLLNMIELFYLAIHYNEFDTLDTSASTSTATKLSSVGNLIWSSTQYSGNAVFGLQTFPFISSNLKNYNNFVCPVLEIPLS